MYMNKKDFIRGVEASTKANEAFMRKQAAATEELGKRIVQKIDDQGKIIDVVLDELSAQEKKRVYDLNTVVNISDLDETEKEYLCSIVYAVAKLDADLTDEQKSYLRTLKSYLKIVNVQSNISLASIENIENITTQKAIMQTIMEFLFLKYENHDYMDDYEELFDCFSVNRRGIREIQNGIDEMYEIVGIEGIAEHYGRKAVIQSGNISKADLNLRQKAEDAYLKYDMKTAFPLFELLMEQGDDRSCYFLGQIYEFGHQSVVKRDKLKAREYRQKGAEMGDSLCALKMADCTNDPKEKNQIYNETYETVLTLAENGDIYAMFEIARLFHFAYEAIKNIDKAKFWYSQSAKAGYWSALNNLGNLYSEEKDEKTAIQYYQKAVDIGYASAMGNLAWYYQIGDVIPRNISKAKELFKMAAENGDSSAQCKLGSDYLDDEEYTEAYKWLELAIANGNSKGYYYMAKWEMENDTDKRYKRNWLSINGDSFDPERGDFDYINDPNWHSLNDDDRSTMNLLLGANCGDKRAQIELAGRCSRYSLLSPGIWTILEKYKPDFLQAIGYEVNFGISKFPIELVDFEQKDIELSFAYRNLKSNIKKLNNKMIVENGKRTDELTILARDVLAKYAEEGEPAAQYYLGMYYAKKYEYSCSDSDKRPALKWLRMCENDVDAPNLSKMIKCLNKFVCVNYPPCDSFV